MSSFTTASKLFRFLLPCLMAMSGIAFAADVVITSEQKGTEVIALGYIEFPCVKGDPKASSSPPGTVLVDDLHFSGRFNVRFATTFDTSTKTLFKQDGALAYLRGSYTLEKDRYTLDCELVDIDSGTTIIKKHYEGPKEQLRLAATSSPTS